MLTSQLWIINNNKKLAETLKVSSLVEKNLTNLNKNGSKINVFNLNSLNNESKSEKLKGIYID